MFPLFFSIAQFESKVKRVWIMCFTVEASSLGSVIFAAVGAVTLYMVTH